MQKSLIYLSVAILCILIPLGSCSDKGVNNSERDIEELSKIKQGEIQIIELVHEDAIIVSDGFDEVKIHYNHGTSAVFFDCGDFHLEFAPDYIREYTEFDELIIKFKDVNFPRRTEVYTYNGEEFEIDVQDGRPSEEDFQEFLRHYNADPNQNTLEENPDGKKMMALIEKAKPKMFAIWRERDPESYFSYMHGQEDENLLETSYIYVNAGCGYATLCGAIKCWFGGLANSICFFCTFVSLMCAVLAILGV